MIVHFCNFYKKRIVQLTCSKYVILVLSVVNFISFVCFTFIKLDFNHDVLQVFYNCAEREREADESYIHSFSQEF